MRYRTYTLRIERTSSAADPDATDGDALDRALCDAEDSVNNILPEGYYCKIDESGEGVDLAAVRALEAIGDA